MVSISLLGLQDIGNIFVQIGNALLMLIELVGGMILGVVQLIPILGSAQAFIGAAIVGLPAPLQSVIPIGIALVVLKLVLPGQLGA